MPNLNLPWTLDTEMYGLQVDTFDDMANYILDINRAENEARSV